MKSVKFLMITTAVAVFAAAPWKLAAQPAPGNAATAPGEGAPGRGAGRGGRGGAQSDWPPAGPTPKAADGHPDLSGNWSPNAIRQNVDMVGSGVAVPLQPWAEKVYKERKENISKDDPEARCLPPGVPRMSTTPYPFRIVQTPNVTVIVYEGGAHVWRQIFTDGRKHSEDPNPSWLGESIGHWEGDTLVVDTIGFNGKTWIDESGLPTSESLHVIERFHRTDLGHMEIEHTVDDPKV